MFLRGFFLRFVDGKEKGKKSYTEENEKKPKQTSGGEGGRAREGGPLYGVQVSAATRRTCTSSDGADTCHHVVAVTRRPWRQSVSGEVIKRET